MSSFIDIPPGSKFGRLTVLSRDSSIKGRGYWQCQCDCGEKKTILSDSLRSGKTRSCGCLAKEQLLINNTKRKSFATNKTIWIEYGGEKLSAAQFFAKYQNGSVRRAAFYNRLKRGMDPFVAATLYVPPPVEKVAA